MDKKKTIAGKLFARGMGAQEIADHLSVSVHSVRDWSVDEGWLETRAFAQLDAEAAALKADAGADEKFRGLAEAIQALAAGAAQKAKTAGLKSRDILDLAKAVELAQRIRQRTRGGSRPAS